MLHSSSRQSALTAFGTSQKAPHKIADIKLQDYPLIFHSFLALLYGYVIFSRRSAAQIFDKLQQEGSPHAAHSLTPEAKKYIWNISWMLPTISQRLPWRSDCTIQSIAAHTLLARRNINSDFYVGVRKDEQNGLLAHSWLTCQGVYVTGYSEQKFSPILQPPASS